MNTLRFHKISSVFLLNVYKQVFFLASLFFFFSVIFFDNASHNELILNLARNNNSNSLINIDTGFFIHIVKPGIN